MSTGNQVRVVFIEDDAPLREAVVQGLELEGISVEPFETAAPALQHLTREFDGVVVSDIRLPGMDGLEMFEAVRALDDELPVIFTTGHGDVAMAVDAMKNGASDFLTKPYSSAAILDAIRRAAGRRALVIENRRLRDALRSRTLPALLGSSALVDRLKRLVAEVSRAEIDLFLTGESGTGKSFLARQIHDLSPRHERPFVTIGAETWAHQDAELIIFGRDPGSALSRSGLIERASGGTLFLDDIETIPVPLQARMLGVVEQRRYLPIGAARPRQANLRIVSAARNLLAEGETDGGVSRSLINRLQGVTLALPPLASRREDVPVIFRHFVAEFEREFDRSAKPIGDTIWQHLMTHLWPGNLHELRAFARNHVLELDSPAGSGSGMPGRQSGTLRDRLAAFERAVLEDTLRNTRGNIPQAIDELGLPRKTLYDKLARHRLNPRDYRLIRD
ncbi:sigma-54-dependent transcriptional regulator [Pelagerythrobacter marensis]|uniref:Two component, sigma54 specific, transcriptional regulator, Fis family protein n=1 Tax=Pelagerythrobacter marensis TaxID=543877 RepID=A0A0G3XE45_9SPHN|nr:sigma-54 dependent transcriptional regulator [Pelagerythrobacter marensis]AKM08623.1 Two component, sigma54 specific, transcriptional regulator, Fis family protein [Pelagerythrobacter marensis]